MKRLLLFVAVISFAGAASAMTLDEYIGTLERVRAAVLRNDYAGARAAAQTLHGQTVDSPNGAFAADDSLEASLTRPDARVAVRLAATIEELRALRGESSSAAPNTKLVDEIDKAQHSSRPGAGGNLPLDDAATDRAQRLSDAMRKAWEWTSDKITDFLDWLGSFWPESKSKEQTSGSIRGMVIGLAIVIAATVATLAWITIRRSRRPPPDLVDSAAPVASARDADPLSRAANEWERYAAQLAAAARYREAIRAWYHAVLVTLYGAAILHFRKGRTNWEYISMLSPTVEWRREFIALTRGFEHEWYGATDSDNDALEDCARLARTILAAVARTQRGAA